MSSREISEQAARDVLARAGSAAQDPRSYAGYRYPSGWVFSWASLDAELPVGEAPWIVTDAGEARRVPIEWDAVDFLRATADRPADG